MIVFAPVSVGELIDKITILRIKTHEITQPSQLANIEQELQLLEELRDTLALDPDTIDPLEHQLYGINSELWAIENYKRSCEATGNFDAEFVQAARNVYLKNDQRADVKRRINQLTNSSIREEKQHTSYTA